MTLPNYTQVSNEFIALLPELTGEEVKIFLAISRKTIGWHKESDRIPYSQLKKMTGIRSHETLKKAAIRLQSMGLVDITGDAKVGYTYDLAMRSDRTQGAAKCDGVARGGCDGVAPHKETTQKKQDSAPTERAAPPGTAEAPVPFPLATIREGMATDEAMVLVMKQRDIDGIADCQATIREEVFKTDAAIQAVFDAEYPKILDADCKAAMTSQVAPDINVGTKTLEDRLWSKFLAIQPDQLFPATTYAKERRGVQRLVKEALKRQPADPEGWLGGYVAAWARLRRDRKSLIYGQPNAPAVMSSGAFMLRVIDEMAQAALFENTYEEIIPF